jgi:WD40 repeat protein
MNISFRATTVLLSLLVGLPLYGAAPQPLKELPAQRGSIMSIAFHPSEPNLLVTSDWDARVRLLDVVSNTVVWESDFRTDPILGPECSAWVQLQQAKFSPDGRHIAVAGSCVMTLISGTDGRLIKKIYTGTNKMNATAFSKDGRFVASTNDKFSIIWDIETGQVVRTFPTDKKWNNPYCPSPTDCISWVAQSMAFSDDGRYLLTASHSHLTVWDIQSGAPRTRIESLNEFGFGSALPPRTGAAAFSPNLEYGLATHLSGAVLFDMETGRLLRQWSGEASTEAVTFSPDHCCVLAGDRQGVLWYWNISDGSLIRKIDTGKGPISVIQFSDDKRHLLTAHYGRVFVWDFASLLN